MAEPLYPPLRFTDENGGKRRSIADALEVLHRKPGFSDQTRAVLRTMSHPLPNGGITWSAVVICEELGWAVPLPTSIRSCSAIRDGESVREELAMMGLDEVVVDADGKVTLSDGTRVRGLRFPPNHLRMSLTPQQMLVIHAAIHFAHAESRCYCERSFTPLLHGERIVLGKYIDFRAVLGLKLHGLKAFMKYLIGLKPGFDLSRQTVSNILRDCGIVICRQRRAGKPCKRAMQ